MGRKHSMRKSFQDFTANPMKTGLGKVTIHHYPLMRNRRLLDHEGTIVTSLQSLDMLVVLSLWVPNRIRDDKRICAGSLLLGLFSVGYNQIAMTENSLQSAF